jgi:hypothetical protein
MRELQQVTATGHRSAKRCRFYRVELLNWSKYRTRGETPPNRRKRGKDGRSGKGGKVEEQEQSRWKIFIKQKPKISKSGRKGGFVGTTAKNGNTAKAGDFRLFAARGVSFFVGKTFLFFHFLSFLLIK